MQSLMVVNDILKRQFVVVLVVVLSGSPANADEPPNYLDIVRAYADAMLEHGWDMYGEVQSPLFAEALDRHTMRMLEGDAQEQVTSIPRQAWGIRPHDRGIAGGNPQHCQNLYQILYALTEVTGQPRYANSADRSLEFFLAHCQGPATGLFYWGEHAGWDFHSERPLDKPAGNTHEFYRPWVLWDRSWDLAPESCLRFARGLWQHQIGNHQTGDYSRHAPIDSHGPGTEAPYARHGGFYIETWATAYERTSDETYLQAISSILSGLQRARLHEGGMLIAGSKRGGARRGYDISLAVSLGNAADKVEPGLAARMCEVAATNDRAFAEAHRDDSVPPTHAANDAATLWSNAYGGGPPANQANVCMLRYRQVPGAAYRRVVLQTADEYRKRKIHLRRPVWPGTVGSVVLLMLGAHGLTDQEEYLEAAQRFAAEGVRLFLRDDCPLPSASHMHDHYEAVTNGDTLMMALLRLWQVKNRPELKLRLVYCDR